jgi:hypothetical protein
MILYVPLAFFVDAARAVGGQLRSRSPVGASAVGGRISLVLVAARRVRQRRAPVLSQPPATAIEAYFLLGETLAWGADRQRR